MQQRGHRAGHGDTACGAQFLHLGNPLHRNLFFCAQGLHRGGHPGIGILCQKNPGGFPIIDGPLGLLEPTTLEPCLSSVSMRSAPIA